MYEIITLTDFTRTRGAPVSRFFTPRICRCKNGVKAGFSAVLTEMTRPIRHAFRKKGGERGGHELDYR
jgi:hypothetical protein